MELKVFMEWVLEFEKEVGMKVLDNDGARELYSQGRLGEKICEVEARELFSGCTLVPENWEGFR